MYYFRSITSVCGRPSPVACVVTMSLALNYCSFWLVSLPEAGRMQLVKLRGGGFQWYLVVKSRSPQSPLPEEYAVREDRYPSIRSSSLFSEKLISGRLLGVLLVLYVSTSDALAIGNHTAAETKVAYYTMRTVYRKIRIPANCREAGPPSRPYRSAASWSPKLYSCASFRSLQASGHCGFARRPSTSSPRNGLSGAGIVFNSYCSVRPFLSQPLCSQLSFWLVIGCTCGGYDSVVQSIWCTRHAGCSRPFDPVGRGRNRRIPASEHAFFPLIAFYDTLGRGKMNHRLFQLFFRMWVRNTLWFCIIPKWGGYHVAVCYLACLSYWKKFRSAGSWSASGVLSWKRILQQGRKENARFASSFAREIKTDSRHNMWKAITEDWGYANEKRAKSLS